MYDVDMSISGSALTPAYSAVPLPTPRLVLVRKVQPGHDPAASEWSCLQHHNGLRTWSALSARTMNVPRRPGYVHTHEMMPQIYSAMNAAEGELFGDKAIQNGRAQGAKPSASSAAPIELPI